ncbi:MAG: HAD family phosphatase [OM182 bacterium]|jgi:HAD superfamily hydrolase (TIGR01509 family)|nr:MAG: HAD family phosphatase [OM182 bacterium]|tara:strand:- start:3388 stop:4074 length:687 start_codon:yes stop_codon:yes gene_type:complete
MGLMAHRPAQPQGVVFDMDGTLIDTERLAHAAFRLAIADLGFAYREEVYALCLGGSYQGTRSTLAAAYGPQLDLDLFNQRWNRRFVEEEKRSPIRLKPGIEQLLERLQDLYIPMAVATSNNRSASESALEQVGIRDRFQGLVCADDVSRAKPDPEPYLRACALLDIGAAGAWALEDSDVGTAAAVAAGLRVFQIPDARPPAAETLALGHEVIGRADELLTLLDSSPPK